MPPLAFRLGTFARPARVVNTGSANKVLLCRMSTAEGLRDNVYAKALSEDLRSREAVCAWLAVKLGLPIPEPLFITINEGTRVPGFAWPFGGQKVSVLFDTKEIPSAKPLRLVPQASTDLLGSWKYLVEVAVFDALVMNTDRSESNLLLSGKNVISILDHDQCLKEPDLQPDREIYASSSNFLLNICKAFPPAQRNDLHQRVKNIYALIEPIVGAIPFDNLLVPADLAARFSKVLLERARVLRSLILSELGSPELNFVRPVEPQSYRK
jgi:hypothetical protein